jgi:hypothetical protein
MTSSLPASIVAQLNPSELGRDATRRQKLLVWLNQDTPGTVEVTLSGCFSADVKQHPNEAEAVNLLGTADFELRCTASLDLEGERAELAARLDALYESDVGTKLRREDLVELNLGELRTALVPFARQGWSIYYRLFQALNNLDSVVPERAPILQGALNSLLARPQAITVHSSVPLFPWNFLYNAPVDESHLSTLQPEKFWGFDHEIQQRVKGTSGCIRVPAGSRIVAAICPNVDKGRHDTDGHPFRLLGERVVRLDSTDRLAAHMHQFTEYCLYFYGHAHHNVVHPVPSSSWIQLGDNKLFVSDLMAGHKPHFDRELVVTFLNGCRMAQLDRWNESTVVGFLCLKGDNRVCCVSPVGPIPEAFAAEFASHFWRCFFVEQPRMCIGRALVEARRVMLEKWNNPLGLLYTIFGRIDTCVEEPERS